MTRSTPRRSRPVPAAAGALVVGATLVVLGSGTALAASNPGSAQPGSSVTSGPAPDVTLTAAQSGDTLAPGVGRPGMGSPGMGSGFVINVKTRTFGGPGPAVKEGLNIRHTDRLGRVNPDFPGLVVTADSTLTKPDGGLIPAGTNLAPLFNIAGTDDSAGPRRHHLGRLARPGVVGAGHQGPDRAGLSHRPGWAHRQHRADLSGFLPRRRVRSGADAAAWHHHDKRRSPRT